jgi:mycothione reductase
MLSYSAELATHVGGGSKFGLRSSLEGVDWPAIRDRVVARTAGTSMAARGARIASPNVTLFEGRRPLLHGFDAGKRGNS